MHLIRQRGSVGYDFTDRRDQLSHRWLVGEHTFRFPSMSEVPQSLVAAGGALNLARAALGLAKP